MVGLQWSHLKVQHEHLNLRQYCVAKGKGYGAHCKEGAENLEGWASVIAIVHLTPWTIMPYASMVSGTHPTVSTVYSSLHSGS